jgi:alkylation response protein AidB-like acyl-CoA dehydrogenase
VSGEFKFSSGCDHAAWLLCGTIIPPNKDGEPSAPGFLLIPRSEFRIDHSSWRVMGLAATGTKSVFVDDAFVPRHRILRFAEAASGAPPGVAVNTNPLYRIAFLALVPYSLATPSLGAAQGALDEFIRQIGHRQTRGAVRGASQKMVEFPQIQMRLAEAATLIDAARLVQRRDCRETLAEVNDKSSVSIDSRIRNRRGHSMVARSAVQVVDSLFYALGGQAIYLDNGVQRAWRDAHAVAQHVSLNWDAVGSMVGQHMLGLPPQGQF